MSHYTKSLVLEATPDAVYAALTTPEGLQGWWTEDCDIASGVGATLHFRFGQNYKDMRIEKLVPGREVHWCCTVAHIAVGQLTRKDEWVGTQIVFRLSAQGEGHTRLDFEHIGLVPALECYDLCNNGWNYFLASIQQFVATGRGTPYEMASGECETHGASA